MRVGSICSGTTVLAERDENALVAAQRMRECNVGSLIVVDALQRPVGIVTDRDLALRVLAAGRDPKGTTVAEAMTANPRTVSEDTPLEEALAEMRGLGIRRCPVVDARGRLAGIVSADDALEHLARELGSLARVFGWSQPGSAVPAPAGGAEPPHARRAPAGSSGLERATSDIQC